MTTMTEVLVRPMTEADAGAVLAIYQAGMDGGNASFDTTAPTWEAFDRGRLAAHRYVAEADGAVQGWIAVSPTSSRECYAGVVELSVYIAPSAQGRGIGALLMDTLITSSEQAGIWTIQAGIFPENVASLRLHERAGFRVVGVRERIGRHDGRWRDVIVLERRSAVVD
jgi:phosphinothricin acetyltransferase